ncbi:hypothetical protein RLIN73S_02575 [Rhodanobacter lindaniclasticus]
MVAPSRICTRNKASTVQKYLAVAFIDGVGFSSVSGSRAGIGGSGSWLTWRAWCQPSRPMPRIRNSTLNTDHMKLAAVGVLPASVSCGQFCV